METYHQAVHWQCARNNQEDNADVENQLENNDPPSGCNIVGQESANSTSSTESDNPADKGKKNSY